MTESRIVNFELVTDIETLLNEIEDWFFESEIQSGRTADFLNRIDDIKQRLKWTGTGE